MIESGLRVDDHVPSGFESKILSAKKDAMGESAAARGMTIVALPVLGTASSNVAKSAPSESRWRVTCVTEAGDPHVRSVGSPATSSFGQSRPLSTNWTAPSRE